MMLHFLEKLERRVTEAVKLISKGFLLYYTHTHDSKDMYSFLKVEDAKL